MIRYGITDSLLVMQTATTIVSPWNYRIVELESGDIVKSQTGITAGYVLVTLSSADFEDYQEKELLLEIYNNSGVVLEFDSFLISNIYSKKPELVIATGLAGENIIRKSPNESDFQQGHILDQAIELYGTDNTLTTKTDDHEFSREFVQDFNPDLRFHIEKEVQKES